MKLLDIHTSTQKAVTSRNRLNEYIKQSDPLFMEAIRKEAAGDHEGATLAQTAALKAVAAIKEKYPFDV
ncbi:hypothetical protein A7985_05345 [Pseudoalteromonas luteoviolacea]|uniref:Uncharacterized protein n=1 Tax=Pseudoalteromonas luteoviolacea TaxID=43657 RepID=A0A1C0TVL8_9GAMM|nr:hypothetical protein [Pseudoalteromonas luteoviolacea]OCQ23367.1 hypothetical protein A7985_05345 [Pseudoalteromonas luteoviolacea]